MPRYFYSPDLCLIHESVNGAAVLNRAQFWSNSVNCSWVGACRGSPTLAPPNDHPRGCKWHLVCFDSIGHRLRNILYNMCNPTSNKHWKTWATKSSQEHYG